MKAAYPPFDAFSRLDRRSMYLRPGQRPASSFFSARQRIAAGPPARYHSARPNKVKDER
jgi:hypothetical protein